MISVFVFLGSFLFNLYLLLFFSFSFKIFVKILGNSAKETNDMKKSVAVSGGLRTEVELLRRENAQLRIQVEQGHVFEKMGETDEEKMQLLQRATTYRVVLTFRQ